MIYHNLQPTDYIFIPVLISRGLFVTIIIMNKNIPFLILNIFCSASAVVFSLILLLSQFLSVKLFNTNFLSENDSYFFMLCFIFGVIYLFVKLLAFPILYLCGRIFPKIHYELKKCLKNKKAALILALKLDIFIILLFSLLLSIIRRISIAESFIAVLGVTILALGGVTTSYIIFFALHMLIKTIFKDYLKYGKME